MTNGLGKGRHASIKAFAMIPILGLSLIIGGCGSSHGTSAPRKTPLPTLPPTAVAITVKTAEISVNGNSETVFTNAAGMTLYYFTPDTPTQIACTARAKLPDGKSCTAVWPPFTTSASTVRVPVGISGNFIVYKGANGGQVEYNGHPLYLFSGDTGPDQSHGGGLLGKWFVATPALGVTVYRPTPVASPGGYAY